MIKIEKLKELDLMGFGIDLRLGNEYEGTQPESQDLPSSTIAQQGGSGVGETYTLPKLKFMEPEEDFLK